MLHDKLYRHFWYFPQPFLLFDHMTEDSRGREAYWHSSFFFSLFKYWTLDSFCVCLYQNTCALLFQIQRSLWHLYIPHWPHRSSWVSGMPRIGWGRTGVPSWPHLWVPPSAIPAVQLFGLLTEKRNINLSFNLFQLSKGILNFLLSPFDWGTEAAVRSF